MADQLGSLEALDAWIRCIWRNVPDPSDVELIRTVSLQLDHYAQNLSMEGDCDDAATVAGSLLVAMKYPCALRAIRMPHETDFSHVSVRSYASPNRQSYFDIDPIVPSTDLPITGAAEALGVWLWP